MVASHSVEVIAPFRARARSNFAAREQSTRVRAAMVVPARTPEELSTEAMLGRYLVVVVEGPTDARYLQLWMDELQIRAVAISVTEVDTQLYVSGEFGNRDRVIALAAAASDADCVRFLVDRDTEADPRSDLPALLHTHFPGVGNVCAVRTCSRASSCGIQSHAAVVRLPPTRATAGRAAVSALTSDLSRILVPLFRLRQAHRSTACEVEFPVDLRRFMTSGSAPRLDWAKLCRTLVSTLIQSET